MLTLTKAKVSGCCRICGGRILEPGDKPMGYPKGWKESFRKMLFPLAITLNFGDEFAHTSCLETIEVKED